MVIDVLVGLVVLASFVGAAVWMIRARARREERDAEALASAEAQNLHIPQTLHPVIDPDICIGSLSCLEVCPEGDILGVVDGRATLINAAACIGHGKCALECPVDAIKLVFGTAQRGQDLPEVDEFFESSRAGVHVVGELGGMGLIKNAITQGLQVAAHLGDRMKRSQVSGATDVVIVGAGPAGLATALGLKKAGLSFRVLEQESLGGTIAHYPRQKVVMTERVELPFYGKFGRSLISKEDLLESWQRALAKAKVSIEPGVKVTTIEGSDGEFTVQTSKGSMRARKVVLATGRRGSPRKLGCKGEELEKVSYRLIDPEQYDGAKVLVVGGGDSALEAAIQLAEQSDAQVTISYRNEAFGKCREANKRKIAELIQQRAVTAMMASQVMEVRPQDVLMQLKDRQVRLPNDFVLVCIGGELPTEFLSKAGVGLRRHFGTAPGAVDEPAVATARARRGSAKEEAEKRRHRRFVLSLFTIGALIVAGLMVVGFDYYRLSVVDRLASPLHKALRPAGVWGHGVGIVATAVMLSNFLYAVRKRWRLLKGAGPIRRWLTFHQFVGFMSPLVIAFHAAFQSNNFLASGTAASLAVVVATGIVGRFVYGLVPTHEGHTVEYAEVLSRWERLKSRVEPLLEGVTNVVPVHAVLERATAPAVGGSLTVMLAGMPLRAWRTRRQLRRIRPLFQSKGHFRQFAEAFYRIDRLRTQVGFYKSLRRLLSVWRVLHVLLAVFLVLMIAAHIAVSLFLGYRWIFA